MEEWSELILQLWGLRGRGLVGSGTVCRGTHNRRCLDRVYLLEDELERGNPRNSRKTDWIADLGPSQGGHPLSLFTTASLEPKVGPVGKR